MSKKQDDEKDIITFKLITLGDSGVGKTSILKRFVIGRFEERIINTIGFTSSSKDITLKNGTKVRLKLIDTAGQEQYQALAKTYIKNAEGVLFVFSHDKKESFDNIKKWLDNFRENNFNFDFNKTFPAYLVGNKCDLEKVIKKEEIEQVKAENNFYGYIDTSAKDDIGINKLFEEIAEMLINVYGKKKGGYSVKLSSASGPEKKKKGCDLLCGSDL